MNTNIKEIDVTLLLERIEKERINKLKACKKYYKKIKNVYRNIEGIYMKNKKMIQNINNA